MNKTDIFQTAGTLAAIVISLSALFVSIRETRIMESQQKAMVWPYLELQPLYDKDGFSLVIRNKGTGPALIRSMQVAYKGKTVKSYFEILDLIDPNHGYGFHNTRTNSLNQTVLSAGEEKELIYLPFETKGKALVEKFVQSEMIIQFCSVLDDCWILSTENPNPIPGFMSADIEFEF